MRAVSSVYGRMETLLFTMPVAVTDHRPEELVEALYRPLLRDLPHDRKYIVLALRNTGDRRNNRVPYEDEEGCCRRDIRIDRHCITLICTDLNTLPSFRPVAARQRMSRWAQDAFIALENDTGTVLLRPVESMIAAPDNRAEFFTADFLALAAGMLIRPFGCRVQGGDVLVGDNYALVGRRTFVSNARCPDSMTSEEEQRIAGEFRRALGMRHIIPVGFPAGGGDLYHIDYYVTLGGRNRQGAELLFVGRIQEGCLFTAEDDALRRKAAEVAAQYNEYLDNVAAVFSECRSARTGVKFDVVRLPLILDFFRRGEFVIRPYNNCLVEVYGTVRNAYLPHYYEDDGTGANLFGEAERSARIAFEEHGFTVTMVRDNFCNTTRLGGSLRCMVKELGRSKWWGHC